MNDHDNTVTSPWHWKSPQPIQFAPFFDWPPRPQHILRYLLGNGFLLSLNSFYVILAIAIWWYLAPSMETWRTFAAGWIIHLFFLNLLIIGGTAASLHLYLHTYQGQGTECKFDSTEPRSPDSKFFGNKQIWDNIFWTVGSGITIWTGFQATVLWAYANGIAPWLDWYNHPVWFVALFILLPLWGGFHFYLIHRFLHWRPLYRIAHAVHHRNTNPIPWSGLSMHPIEHMLYLSFVFIHLLIATHPIHMLFLSYTKLVSAITSHSGYEDLLIKGRRTVEMGEFFHHIHHRYFDCNYGTLNVPIDRWLKSFHDGSPGATRRIRHKQMALRRKPKY